MASVSANHAANAPQECHSVSNSISARATLLYVPARVGQTGLDVNTKEGKDAKHEW